jgi:diguanylate cyclase (GGDEF)-like protein
MPRSKDHVERHVAVPAALAALSALAVVAGVVAFLLPGSTRIPAINVSWVSAGFVSVVGVAAARARAAEDQRGGWSLILLGCCCWFFVDVLWCVYTATSFPASPNLTDAGWLASAVFAALGVHRLGHGTHLNRSTGWLELAPLVVAVCSLLTALLFEDIVASDLDTAARVTALAYPVFFASAALVMIQAAIARGVHLRRNPGVAAVLGGMVLQATAFILWCPALLADHYVAGANLVDGMWSVAMLAIGLGASRARPVVPVREAAEVSSRRGGILPSLTMAALITALVAMSFSETETGADIALSLGLAIVGATLSIRSTLLHREQAAMLRRERELNDLNESLSEASRRDPLTGLGNRLGLAEELARITARTPGAGYSLVMCDLDRFKQLNDQLGHQAGDDVLREVAAVLARNARGTDRIFRFGGEEMLLVLPEPHGQAAHAVAERHRAAVEASAIRHPTNTPRPVVTLSAGVATAHPGEHPEDVLRRADDALYAAKAAGRNRIGVAEDRFGASRS